MDNKRKRKIDSCGLVTATRFLKSQWHNGNNRENHAHIRRKGYERAIWEFGIIQNRNQGKTAPGFVVGFGGFPSEVCATWQGSSRDNAYRVMPRRSFLDS